MVAAFGAYALGFHLLRARLAAVGAGVFYALSAYFATHAQHVGMAQTVDPVVIDVSQPSISILNVEAGGK